MRIWIFDVDHSSCVFVRAPSGRTLMIDCGKQYFFSPARYLYDYEFSVEQKQGVHVLDELVISHPHDDHINDVENVMTLLRPDILRRQTYHWPEVEEGKSADYNNLHRYVPWQSTYTVPRPDPWWGGLTVQCFGNSVAVARDLPGSFVNNSSLVVVLSYGHFKMVVPGDLEKGGWQALLRQEAFCSAIRGATVFVASHHGHESGYTPEIYDAMGLPIVNVISCRSKDSSVCSEYSRPSRAYGFDYFGAWRRSLSTRTDGSLWLDVPVLGPAQIGGFRFFPNQPLPIPKSVPSLDYSFFK